MRNTLWTLFTLDDESKAQPSSSSSQQNKKVGSFEKPVFEETENSGDDVDGDEIRSVTESHLENSRTAVELEVNNGEIVEEEEEEEREAQVADLKIKENINQEKKSSGGGFWAAASVFSKKLQKWRQKQKMKKQNINTTLPISEKPISRQYRETQSEIADYGYGRRSCDTEPRFSLDDGARYSFEEPRASWDGYLMGRAFPRMLPPMLSVMEDADSNRPRPRPDMQIPVEEGETVIPGGTLQTKEYYSDSRRRKSVDRSGSTRKAEVDELKMVSNAKVSPTTADCFHGARELRDSNSQSMSSETFECSNGERKEMKKKGRGWSWRIWGFKFIQSRRNSNSRSSKPEAEVEEEEEKYSRVNMFRSNSSVSCRNGGGSFGSMRRYEKNRSARFSSPSHVENGMWRFYLTPMRGSRRSGGGGGGGLGNKIKHNNSNSIARSVLRLY